MVLVIIFECYRSYLLQEVSLTRPRWHITVQFQGILCCDKINFWQCTKINSVHCQSWVSHIVKVEVFAVKLYMQWHSWKFEYNTKGELPVCALTKLSSMWCQSCVLDNDKAELGAMTKLSCVQWHWIVRNDNVVLCATTRFSHVQWQCWVVCNDDVDLCATTMLHYLQWQSCVLRDC